MFAFLTITYNHENYIISHLESIKYQIEQYGQDKVFKLVISDDGSRDRTILFAETWLKMNEGLFQEVSILTSLKNQGVVKNYLRAVGTVGGHPYKLLAGDDLYYKNNIIRAMELAEFYDAVFTPTITFEEGKILDNRGHVYLVANQNPDHIRRMFKIANIFNAPGALFSSEFISEKGLWDALSPYTWIEDMPTWNYLFNIRKSARYVVETTPYILYRHSAGLSTSKKNEKNDMFTIEREKMMKDLGMEKTSKGSQHVFDSIYWRSMNLKIRFIDKKRHPGVMEYQRNMDQALLEAPGYLRMLDERTAEWHRLCLIGS